MSEKRRKNNNLTFERQMEVLTLVKRNLPHIETMKMTMEEGARWAEGKLGYRITEHNLRHVVRAGHVKWPVPEKKPAEAPRLPPSAPLTHQALVVFGKTLEGLLTALNETVPDDLRKVMAELEERVKKLREVREKDDRRADIIPIHQTFEGKK